MRPLKILYVSSHWSTTPTSASEVRTLQVAQALRSVGQVEVVSVREREPDTDDDISRSGPAIDTIHTHVLSNRGWTERAKWLFDPRSVYPHGVAVDVDDANRLRNAAREYDLIWFYKLRTANMLPEWSWPRSVVDIDDVPSLFEQSAVSGMSLPARFATQLRARSWQRRERLLGERFNVLTVCSEPDRQYLRQLGVSAPIHVVANGYDPPTQPSARTLASPPRLGFIGVFDHAPNALGVEWFVTHCWPLIKRDIPDARLRLVGRYTDGPRKPTGQDIDALGFVADPDQEMSTWAAMVVPILAGAGTRGKIAHAFSRRCPVVATSLGAYGYEPTDGYDMLLGDSVKDFAEACVRIIRDPRAANAIAEHAWERFMARWTWNAVRPHIWAAAEHGLAEQNGNNSVVFDMRETRPIAAAPRELP